jgi:hypothetical protein
MAPASEEVQGPSASLAVSDPVGAGGWSSEMTQMPQSGIDGWLTQAMQASAPAPAFDAGSDPIAGTAPSVVFATPNPLQTHTA